MGAEGSAHVDALDVPATGRVLSDRYRVGKLIRAGGMGSVYEGEHMATGRRVALKLVHLRSPLGTELEQRFLREARIASNVQSKHIVQVFDAGRDDALGPFIAMELLRGRDLETHLQLSGTLSPRTACEVAYQAARGLEKAHAANVAHRDLKPGNVFLVDSDEDDFLVKVLDFGIAKLFENDLESSAKLTREGSTLGTPMYMSPEQARGIEDIDGRTDIYSLGAVLYEAIIGRPHVPDLANYNQLVVHIATEQAPRLSQTMPDIDPRIDRLVADMLIADRRDRIQTMRAVRERIAAILGSERRGTMPSIADGSGSFVKSIADRPSNRRVSAMRSADDAVESGGEAVHFFDRSSLAQPAAASAEEDEPLPDSSEAVALFDRASLKMAVAPAYDRTSSGAHVVEVRRSSEPPPQISSAPPARTSGSPRVAPARVSEPPMGKTTRRLLVAAIIAVAASIAVSLSRLVMTSEAPSAPPAAAVDLPQAPAPALPPASPTADRDASR